MNAGDGSSWVLLGAFSKDASNDVSAAPSGMTNRLSQVGSHTSQSATFDTNGGVTGWAGGLIALSTKARWRSVVVELLAESAAGTTVTVSPASIAMAGQPIVVNACKAVAITSAAVAYTGKTIAVLTSKIISIAAGAINYIGRAISVNGGGGGGVGSILGKSLRLLLKMGL